MFETVVMLLLSGEFICNVSQPAAFEYLSKEEHLRDVENYLQKIDRRVAKTGKNSGFYLAYASYGERNLSSARSQFGVIKHTLKPIIEFFNLILRITGDETILMSGTAIEADTLLGKIDQDTALRSALQSLGTLLKATSTDGTQGKLLNSVLKRMATDGYIKLVNPERSIYQVTSKIEYLHDTLAFIMAADESIKEQDDNLEGETGKLV